MGPAAASIRHRITVGGPVEGMQDYEALVAESPDHAVGESVGLGDLLLLPHTSGTTGNPKAVMLTHGNVTWNAVNFLTSADFRRDDVTIAIAPFFRVGGTGVNVLPVLFVGGTVVVPDDPQPDALLRLMERHRVTVGFGNPDLLDAIAHADRWPSADLSSVRFVVTGGAPVPERLIRAYLERGVTLLQGYGLSEAAPLVLLLGAEHALAKVGSAGRPPLFVEVRIIDDAGGDVAAWRHRGAAGPRSQRHGRLLEAARGNARGAHRGGMAAHGRCGPHGRRRRRLDRGSPGGPLRLRRARLSIPAMSSGRSWTIRRLQTPAWSVSRRATVSMVGAAFVVLSPGAAATEEELLAFCRGRLTAHQVPTSISFVDALPRNAVGKLLRDDLSTLASRGSPGGD